MKKVRGSASGFQWGNLVLTRYASGCHRAALIKSTGVSENIDQKHMTRGALNEELYEQNLRASNTSYVREEPVSELIDGFSDTYFAGRLDFRVHLDGGQPERIDELKSTESSTVLNEIIKKGHYKYENLAQLISYMIAKRLVNGRLIYTYFKIEKNTKVYSKGAERIFCVVIKDDGSIEVDNVKTVLKVEDQLNHRFTQAHCISHNVVWARPFKAQDFDGPCKFCVFSPVCNKYDAGLTATTEQFIAEAAQLISQKGNK